MTSPQADKKTRKADLLNSGVTMDLVPALPQTNHIHASGRTHDVKDNIQFWCSFAQFRCAGVSMATQPHTQRAATHSVFWHLYRRTSINSQSFVLWNQTNTEWPLLPTHINEAWTPHDPHHWLPFFRAPLQTGDIQQDLQHTLATLRTAQILTLDHFSCFQRTTLEDKMFTRSPVFPTHWQV